MSLITATLSYNLIKDDLWQSFLLSRVLVDALVIIGLGFILNLFEKKKVGDEGKDI